MSLNQSMPELRSRVRTNKGRVGEFINDYGCQRHNYMGGMLLTGHEAIIIQSHEWNPD
jgi:hypothetical protein